MGRGHGATRGGGAGGGIEGLPWTQGIKSNGFDFSREAPKGVFAAWNEEALNRTLASIDANVKDPQMRAEMKAAVEKMSKEMGGLPTGREGMKIEIGTAKGFNGATWYGNVSGNTITLNKKVFGGSYQKAEGIIKPAMDAGRVTSVSKPALKTFVHEFGHKYYKGLSSEGRMKAEQVFSHFQIAQNAGHKSTSGWGKYSGKSSEEFYSDAVAKSVLGGSDKWTRILGSLR